MEEIQWNNWTLTIEDAKNKCIHNLYCEMGNSNQIRIRWEWPDFESDVGFVYAFEVQKPTETLKSILKRNAEMKRIPRNVNLIEGYNYVETLTKQMVQYKLFPVDNKEAVIFEQMEGNCTPVFYKRITLHRTVEYDYRNFFFGFKIATFHIKEKDRLSNLPPNALQYYKYEKNSGRLICRYPIDLDFLRRGGYGVVVPNECGVDLCCNEEYNGAIIIKDC